MEWVVVGLVVLAFFSGVPRGIISIQRKSLAAAAIQALLEQQAGLGMKLSNRSPADAAREYVEAAWDSKPDVFNGRFGQRPHKISVVVYALALAAKRLNRQSGEFLEVMQAGCAAFSEVETNRHFYPLTKTDAALIKEAMEMFVPIADAEEKEALQDEAMLRVHEAGFSVEDAMLVREGIGKLYDKKSGKA
jgi:hypothetical protein